MSAIQELLIYNQRICNSLVFNFLFLIISLTLALDEVKSITTPISPPGKFLNTYKVRVVQKNKRYFTGFIMQED